MAAKLPDDERTLASGGQSWNDKEFCDLYESIWEIATDDVHYGWLAPGEKELGLLRGFRLKNSRVLDIGCGLGENLIALAQQGCQGVGIDISQWMIEKAIRKTADHSCSDRISYQTGDMRHTLGSGGDLFDIILSVYSMEYLGSLHEFRQLIQKIYHKLESNGVFVMCFSHPSQAASHRQLVNSSVALGDEPYRTYNWSFKDATHALFQAGFSVERVVEQGTRNPSCLTYEDARQYPYHFYPDANPCHPSLDEVSNDSPHTVVYKARKPIKNLSKSDRQYDLTLGYRTVWGYRRKITHYCSIELAGLSFPATSVAPMDNVLGLVDVLQFSVREHDMVQSEAIPVSLGDGRELLVSGNSALGLLFHRLTRMGLAPVARAFSVPSEHGETETRALITSIECLDERICEHFETNKYGLLLFVNGEEPAGGALPVDVLAPNIGDELLLCYVALRPDIIDARSVSQETLF